MKSKKARISTPSVLLNGGGRELAGRIRERTRPHLSGTTLQNGLLLPALVLLVFLLSGCSTSQDQVDFEQQAYRTPQNYTETTPNGEVVRRDEDDWRIGPMFQGFVEIQVPPFPNPTRGEPVRVEMYIAIEGTVNGLRAVSYFDMFDERSMTFHYEHNRSPLPFGMLIFDIYPERFDPISRNYSNARSRNDGLHRLFIYDNRWNLISYGDIKLK